MHPDPPMRGVAGAHFVTTHWSAVVTAGQADDPAAQAALEGLCQVYWFPLYAYVRRKGYGVADAQDLTQEFFRRFLERHSFGTADRQKGKVRSFLLASLEHFLAKEWTRANRLKRGGGRTIIAWDACDPEERYRIEPADDWTAERMYDRRWALTVLEQAMLALATEYAAAGRESLFEALKPVISGGDDDVSYPDLATRLQMSPGAVRVAVHRLRQRYGEAVRMKVAELVQRPEDVEGELRHLFAALGGGP